MTKASGAGKLQTLTIGLTDGLTFATHTARGHTIVRGVSIKGAKTRAPTVAHGQLVIVLSKPAKAVTVSLAPAALHETRTLHAKAEHHRLSRLRINVTVKDTAGKVSSLHMQIRTLGQPKTKVQK